MPEYWTLFGNMAYRFTLKSNYMWTIWITDSRNFHVHNNVETLTYDALIDNYQNLKKPLLSWFELEIWVKIRPFALIPQLCRYTAKSCTFYPNPNHALPSIDAVIVNLSNHLQQ